MAASRPYNRSLHPDDYDFLPHARLVHKFEQDMVAAGVPHREWHPHRLWEYGSMMQQLEELGIPPSAQLVDIGAGASFFDPYCALAFPNLCCTDSMKYGDVTGMVQAQRDHYKVGLPLFDVLCEDMSVFADGQFDVTMCISTVEHVDGHDKAFDEMVRITKSGGYIFITSDYFRDTQQWETSPSRHLQVTAYMQAFVESIPSRWPVDFVGPTDFAYAGDFVHTYSFVNICLRKR